ncbi:hypothetical protein F5Y10DRAFT_292997 [Nemania abortiva]|nr:hypothetical protein F5Y10DRAFT_292997 [Nemania abortiva]
MASPHSDTSADSWDLAATLVASTETSPHRSFHTGSSGSLSPPPSPSWPSYACVTDNDLDISCPRTGTLTSPKNSPPKHRFLSEKPSKVNLLPSDKEIVDRVFRFDDSEPPTLADLAVWLGLESEIDVAILLGSFAIQQSFTTYRSLPGLSRAKDPKRLKGAVPLFTFSRETLLVWRSSFKEGKDGIDFLAALFANQVVRFLERYPAFATWRPISEIRTLEAFEAGKFRFAVALQILWFMEKAFVQVPDEVSD